jgi:hypothetical protein
VGFHLGGLIDCAFSLSEWYWGRGWGKLKQSGILGPVLSIGDGAECGSYDGTVEDDDESSLLVEGEPDETYSWNGSF